MCEKQSGPINLVSAHFASQLSIVFHALQSSLHSFSFIPSFSFSFSFLSFFTSMPPANPHEAVQPDFLTERYAAAHQSLVNDFNITNKQAAQRLNTFWLNQNALD